MCFQDIHLIQSTVVLYISLALEAHTIFRASQVALVVKNLPANADVERHRFEPWARRIPWRRAWQPTPVFLPRESHGQRSLAGYSPWGRKESDMTEVTWNTLFSKIS